MNNFRLFEISFLGPTDRKGSRVKIKDLRAETFGFKKSKIISKDYKYNSSIDQAESYIRSLGINIIGTGESLNKTYIISDNFDIDIS